ncbi:MAG: sigma-70 family RNA polymerase sigma factor, partial [Planctomycetia bacterium]|nr:sigma-70 family RNA polymerase sigma factor [Planctomycetia bacterium]
MADELNQNLALLVSAGPVSGLTDAQLLARFVARRGESSEVAFAAIVARHGGLVLGVCRHCLREPADVNDAYQATFLVLVRRAASVRVRDSLGPWLYGVAYKVASRARSDAARRRGRESGGVDLSSAPASPDAGWDDLSPVLHEELNRLPEKYRAPVVLCHLEGKTHEEAASTLRWPVGTVSGRLSRARDLLRSRLSRRGITAPAGVIPAFGIVSPEIPDVTRGVVPESTNSLARGVQNAMFWNQVKLIALALASSVVFAVGAGIALSQTPTAKPPAENPTAAKLPTARPAEAPKKPIKAVEVPDRGALGKVEEEPRPSEKPAFIGAAVNGSIVAAHGREPNALWALSLHLGEWKEYNAPEGTKVSWMMNNDLLAVLQE